MKKTQFILLLIISVNVTAQINTPVSISVSYFGEMISHPGLKVGVNFCIIEKYNGQKIESLNIGISIGSYFHKRYHTGIFFLPELNYKNQFANGNYFSTGIGFGFLYTSIPNTYEVNTVSGKVNKVKAGHQYFLSSFAVSFGKGLNAQKEFPNSLFIKPGFMYAFPNFPTGIGFFALELGTNSNLNRDE